jgi:hypothetical protein
MIAPAARTQDTATAIDVHSDIKALCFDQDQTMHSERGLPWWLFIMLVTIPVLYLFFEGLYLRYKGIRTSGNKEYLARARMLLGHAQRNQQASLIYAIFIDFFSHASKLEVSQLNEDTIDEYLKSQGYSSALCDEWRLFLHRASELAFYQQPSLQRHDSMFEQAYRWLANFEENL